MVSPSAKSDVQIGVITKDGVYVEITSTSMAAAVELAMRLKEMKLIPAVVLPSDPHA